MARHAVNASVARVTGQPSPLSTGLVNIVGCAIIGVLAGLIAAGGLRMTAATRAFVFVGVLGGFTTFSSFGLDTLALAHAARPLSAAASAAPGQTRSRRRLHRRQHVRHNRNPPGA